MPTTPTADAPPTAAGPPMSLTRAFGALVGHAFGRQLRVRQMGWVALGLLTLAVVAVSVVSHTPAGWGFADRRARKSDFTYRQAAAALHDPAKYDLDAPTALPPRPWDATGNNLQWLLLSVPHAVLQSEKFLDDWRFLNFSRWVVLGSYLGFVLPLFTLAYASGAVGGEREGRSLVWLLTRPVPRAVVYLATFVGALPWCLLFGAGGFVALCLAGGDVGRRALALYWPAAVAGTVAFSALFHLIGALFRRPVVVGLVYVFFFESLVAALPGSLKKVSLNFYTRCLMYNEATAAGYPGDMLDVSGPVGPATAWATLAAATVGLTILGMYLFARTEHRDDV